MPKTKSSPCCGHCGTEKYRDCYGNLRCENCDPPCPHCDDSDAGVDHCDDED